MGLGCPREAASGTSFSLVCLGLGLPCFVPKLLGSVRIRRNWALVGAPGSPRLCLLLDLGRGHVTLFHALLSLAGWSTLRFYFSFIYSFPRPPDPCWPFTAALLDGQSLPLLPHLFILPLTSCPSLLLPPSLHSHPLSLTSPVFGGSWAESGAGGSWGSISRTLPFPHSAETRKGVH